jgi:hypothetical protein
MDLRCLSPLILAAAAAGALSACSSFSITSPQDGTVVKLPATTNVTVGANPSMTGLQVKVDGADVSNQIAFVSDAQSRGPLSLPAGRHAISATATVPCWYCSPQPWQASFQTNVCVAGQTSPATPSKTALAKGDTLSWVKTSDTTVGMAPDAGAVSTHWSLIRLGGIASSTGLIQSTENECLCMRSMAAASDTPIGLAVCDGTDPLQQWQALQVPPFGPGNYRIQNNGRGISDACLTEGANNVLVQRPCNDTPQQLWSIRDNITGMLGSPF